MRRRRHGSPTTPTRPARPLTLTFALGAALLSAFLAVTTFGLTRENLIQPAGGRPRCRGPSTTPRTSSAGAPRAAGEVDASEPASGSLPTPAGRAARAPATATSGTPPTGRVRPGRPPPVAARTRSQRAAPARMRFSLDGEPYLVVGVPAHRRGRRRLLRGRVARRGPAHAREPGHHPARRLGSSPPWPAACSAAGPAAGPCAPLLDVGTAAEAIAGGRLDTRLHGGRRPRPRPAWPCRSTTWPRPSRTASTATRASPPRSATSCARR